MNILITGATGLIGTALIESLKDSGCNIYCQSRYQHVHMKGITWIMHDLINDSWSSLSLPEFNVVFYLAAQTSVYEAKENPINDLKVNLLGLLNLLEYVKKQTSSPFVVYSGTATQVGLAENVVIDEGVPDNPITFYDLSKLTAEMYIKQYIKEGWIRGCILRFANVYGRSSEAQSKERGVIDKIYKRALLGESVTIYGAGNYHRDYIFIDDVVSALIAAVKYMNKTNGLHFYIGSGRKTTLREAFLKVIAKAFRESGNLAKLECVNPPDELSDIEFRNVVIDSSAFGRVTGWHAEYDFDAGLDAAYSNFRNKGVHINERDVFKVPGA